MIRKEKSFITIVLFLISLLFIACISEQSNNTSESSLIASVSNELKSELTRRQIQLVESAQEADGILTSEITSLTDATIARRGSTTALEEYYQ